MPANKYVTIIITLPLSIVVNLPFAVPSTAFVEKNAKFLVSNKLSLVQSVPLDCGSDSPVSAELSTYNENIKSFSFYS